MMDAAQLDQIVERLFAAFVAHDLDLVESMLTPDATMSQNGVGGSFALARPTLEGTSSVLGDHHYEDVRRVVGDHAVVEEHRVVSTTPTGHAVDLPACVVVRVDDDGLITSIDEYVDVSTFPTSG
jgi:ketosteroid isomerase-like protein